MLDQTDNCGKSGSAARGGGMTAAPDRGWEDLARRIQRAGLDPTLWPGAVSGVSDRVGARGALLLSTGARFRGFPVTPSLAEPVENFVNMGWEYRDERARGVSALRTKGVITDDDCLSREARARSPFYQEFLRSHDLQEFVAVGFPAGAALLGLRRHPPIGEPALDGGEQRGLLSPFRPAGH